MKKTSKKTGKNKIKSKRAMIDQTLAALTPALRQKMTELQGQLQAGDLRTLGLRVFERAKDISQKIQANETIQQVSRQAVRLKRRMKKVSKNVVASKKKATKRK